MTTVDQLSFEIDSGRTRRKVSAPDPAAVPLGTDEEAAGTPVSPHAAALAKQEEVDAPPKSNEDGGAMWYAAAIAFIAIVMLTGAFLLLR